MAFVADYVRAMRASLTDTVRALDTMQSRDGGHAAFRISDLITTTLSPSLRIPCDVRRENTVWLSLAAMRAASACAAAAASKSLVTTPILTGVLGLAHVDALFPTTTPWGGESRTADRTLSWAGLCPQSVAERGDYWRLISAPASASSTTSFLTHLADLVDATSIIEAAWGTWDALHAVIAASALGQLAYVGIANLVNTYYPEVALAKQYYRYTTGLSITSIAVRTMSGYIQDESESDKAWPPARVYRHRYGWALPVLLNTSLLRLSAACLAEEGGWAMRPYAALEAPGFLEVVAGVVTGVMLGGRERDLVLGLTDLVLQGVLLAGVWWGYRE